jgi:hypothetical protein
MNKFKKGQKVFYLLMDSPCQSNVVDFYTKGGITFYVDSLFNNIKECYLFTSRKDLFTSRKDCVEFHQNKYLKYST